jgi:hypothetical protein
VKQEEARFRQWGQLFFSIEFFHPLPATDTNICPIEQHLIAERDRLNSDLESSHTLIKTLESELDGLGGGGGGSGGYGSAASRATAGRR